MKRNRWKWWLLSFGTWVGVHACAGPTEPKLRDPQVLIAEGWAAYESQQYELAAVKFDSAKLAEPPVAEAFHGAGWSYGKLAEFEQSSSDFDRALDLDPNLPEARAGAALAYHAANRFEDAITQANTVLEQTPDFVFSHDSTVTAFDIRVVLMLSYYSTGDFVNAAMQLDILEPSKRPHSTRPDELLRQIMRFLGHVDGLPFRRTQEVVARLTARRPTSR